MNMKRTATRAAASGLVVVLLPVLFGACAGDAGTTEAEEPEPTAQAELPPGHPPVASSGTSIAPPLAGSGRGSAALDWTAPSDWIEEAPANAMRRAQYRVPGPGGDAECVVYYFGPGQGGDAVANAERWAGQFSQPDGASSRDRLLSRRFEVGDVEVLQVEITGTYNSAMAMGGPTESFPDYMLLGAIAEGADANWFFKFTGPESTVRPQRQAFEKMIRTLSPGG